MGEAVKVFDASNEIVKILDLTPAPFAPIGWIGVPCTVLKGDLTIPMGKCMCFAFFFLDNPKFLPYVAGCDPQEAGTVSRRSLQRVPGKPRKVKTEKEVIKDIQETASVPAVAPSAG